VADKKITELDAYTPVIKTDVVPIVDVTTSTTKKVSIASFWSGLTPPRGFLINGKIVPSVASNNLTVALKGLDGNDPSATNPVYVRIGDTIRSITAALSVTCNAGTNWFNNGATGHATYSRDYFVYLGYNATDGVVIGFSTIPYAEKYSQFSATSTDDKYCAISTITNAAATDAYENIGRFSATLSAGDGYTWSVPTFDTSNLIQRPIRYTQAMTFVFTISTSGVSINSQSGQFILNDRHCYVTHDFNITNTGTKGNLVWNLPITGLPLSSQYDSIGQGHTNDGEKGIWVCFNGDSGLSVYMTKADGTAFSTGAVTLSSWTGVYLI